jgi:hypothetical protein
MPGRQVRSAALASLSETGGAGHTSATALPARVLVARRTLGATRVKLPTLWGGGGGGMVAMAGPMP